MEKYYAKKDMVYLFPRLEGKDMMELQI